MNTIYIILFFLIISPAMVKAQDILELKPSQSMSITGKGPGQDAAINPYSDGNSIGVIENIGKNNFEIRIQKEGVIIELISLAPSKVKEIDLLEGYELYLDSEAKAKARVSFKKLPK